MECGCSIMQNVNISSFILLVRPDAIPTLTTRLAELPGIELHAQSPDGKLIVTLECEDDSTTNDTFALISRLEGVLSVSLVYHQFESDPEQPVAVDNTVQVPRHTKE
jgi:nitrate reductase NapD